MAASPAQPASGDRRGRVLRHGRWWPLTDREPGWDHDQVRLIRATPADSALDGGISGDAPLEEGREGLDEDTMRILKLWTQLVDRERQAESMTTTKTAETLLEEAVETIKKMLL